MGTAGTSHSASALDGAGNAAEGISRSRTVDSVRRFFFGDDVFISYARADATNYALGLANALTAREISCFLDQWGTPPGDTLPQTLLVALRKSTMFVLVGTEGAAASVPVRHEVEEFIACGRPIIPITIDGALEQSPWFPTIRGLSLARESESTLRTGVPSEAVISRIVNAEGFTRRNKRLRKVFWSSVSVMAILLAIGGILLAYQSQRVATQTARANEATATAEHATTDATTAREAAAVAAQDQKRAEEQRAAAESLRTRAESQAKTAAAAAEVASANAERQRRTARSLNLANRATSTLDESGAGLERSLLLALESLKLAWTPEGVAAWQRAMMLQMRPPRLTYSPPAAEDRDQIAAIAAAGRWLAISSGSSFASGEGARSWRGKIIVRSSEPNEELFAIDVDERINALAVTPDGRWLAAGSDGHGVLWDIHARAIATELWSDASRQQSSPDDPGSLPAQREIVRIRNASRQGILTFSPDGQRLSVVIGDAVVRLYERGPQEWREAPRLSHEGADTRSERSRILSAAFSADSRWLATGFHSGFAIWDLATGTRIAEQMVPGGDVFLLAFSGDGKALASMNPSAGLQVWTVGQERNERSVTLDSYIERINFEGNPSIDQIAFSPTRQYLAVRTGDALRLLALDRVTRAVRWTDATFSLGATEAASLKMPPDRLWRRDQQQKWKEVNRVTDARSFAFTNGELVVSSRRAMRTWEDLHSSWEARWLAHSGTIRSWTFSPDGGWLVTVTQDGVLQVFDGQTLERQRLPAAPEDSVVDARFSPDGRWLVVDAATSVRVLKAGTWRLIPAQLPSGSDVQQPISRFTSDGRWLVTIACSRMHVFRTADWEMAGIAGLGSPDPTFKVNIKSVRVSPDGRLIAVRESFMAKRLTRAASNNPTRQDRFRTWSLDPTRGHVSEPSAENSADDAALQRTLANWTGFETGESPERRTANSRWDGTSDGALVRLRPRLAADFIEAGCQRMLRNLSPSEWKEHVGDEPYRQTCADVPGPTGATVHAASLR